MIRPKKLKQVLISFYNFDSSDVVAQKIEDTNAKMFLNI
jgi:hypothetical protein